MSRCICFRTAEDLFAHSHSCAVTYTNNVREGMEYVGVSLNVYRRVRVVANTKSGQTLQFKTVGDDEESQWSNVIMGTYITVVPYNLNLFNEHHYTFVNTPRVWNLATITCQTPPNWERLKQQRMMWQWWMQAMKCDLVGLRKHVWVWICLIRWHGAGAKAALCKDICRMIYERVFAIV